MSRCLSPASRYRALIASLAFGLLACGGDATEGQTDTHTEPDLATDAADPDTSPPEVVDFDTTADGSSDTDGTSTGEVVDGDKLIPAYCATDPGGVFCPCAENAECNSGYCIPSRRGDQVCTRTCDEECPDELECRLVRFPGESDPTFACVDLQANLCRPCRNNSECQGAFGAVSSRCVRYGDLDGAFCGIGCADDRDCPTAYSCLDVQEAESRTTTRQCVPDAGECACSPRAVAESASTSCNRLACFGIRMCGQDGLTECDARVPEPEVCDGIDNNCNGLTDEGFPDTDGDGVADCIDPDIDGDGILNEDDNCPFHPNPDQTDSNGNGIGDACDTPAPPTLEGSLPPSPANDNAPLIFGTAEPGVRVDLYLSNVCGGISVGHALADEDGLFQIPVLVPDDSTTRFWGAATSLFNDFVSPCSDTSVTYIEDSTPPQRPELTGTDPASPGNTTTFAVAGLAEPGSTLSLFADPACLEPLGATTVVGAHGTFSVPTEVDPNDTTTVYASTVDVAGNVSGCSAGITYVHDDIPPPPPTFSGTFPASPSATETTVTIIGGAEAGASITVYPNASCEGEPLTTTGTGTNGVFTVVLTVEENTFNQFTATATDAAGNVSECSAEPVIYIHDNEDPDPPVLVGTRPPSPGNSLLPEVFGTVEPFATVRIFSGPNCTGVSFGTAQADADGSWGITATVNANAETFFYGHATDLAGRRGECTTEPLVYLHDGIAPLPPELVSVTPDSPSPNLAPTVRGTGEPLATIALFLDADCEAEAGATATIGADGAFQVTADAAPNASVTWWGAAIDAAGNISPCSSSAITYVHDNLAPEAPVLTLTRPASPSSNLTPAVEGQAEAGAVVDVFLNATCAGLPAGTGSADADGAFEVVAAVEANTVNALYAAATDAAGNVSACSAVPLFYEHDDSEPLGPFFTGTTPASPDRAVTTPLLLGESELETTVRIHLDADCLTDPIATGETASDGTFEIAVEVSPNTATTFYASAVNVVGNASPCSAPGIRYVHDDIPPNRPTWDGTTPSSPNRSSTTPTLRGRAEAAATVRIFTDAACAGEPIAETTSGSNARFTAEVVATANETNRYYAHAIDAAGNVSACSVAIVYVHDDIPPEPPVLTGTDPESPSNGLTPAVSGTAEGGASIRFYDNPGCTGSLLGQGAANASGQFTITITVGADQMTQIHASATDAAGNVSGCSAALPFENDSTPPPVPVWVRSVPDSPNNTSTTPRLEGTAEAGVLVRLYRNNACTGAIAATINATAGGEFAFDVTVNANSTTSFYAAAVDAVGNQSACSAVLRYVHDTIAPNRPVITGSTPNSPSPNQSPAIRGTAEAASTVRLYTSSDCSGSPVGTATTASNGNWNVPSVQVAANATTTLYASATDAVGNVSQCSVGFPYRHDNIPPNPPVVTGTIPAPLGNNPTPSVTGTVDEPSLRVRIYKTSDCTGTVLREVANVPLSWTATNVPADRNTTTTFYARAVDQAGNVSGCSTTSATYLHDDVAPNDPEGLETDPERWSNVVSTPVVSGTAEAGGTVRIYQSTNCSGPHVETTATGGSFSAEIDVGDADIEVSITATVTDAAGNVSGCAGPIPYRYDTTPPDFAGAATATLPSGVNGETRATITWPAASDNFTRVADMVYRVCRSLRCGATDCDWDDPDAPNITRTGAGVTSRQDTDLLPNTRYYWVVRAVDEVGNEDDNHVVVSVKTRGRQSVSALWVGESSSFAGLSSGGTHRWGTPLTNPTNQNPVGFSLGAGHSCLVRADSNVRCTGGNTYGQLGNGNTNSQTNWVAVSGLSGAVQVAVGLEHSCAVLVSGEVRCWGNDSRGQLGNGTGSNVSQSTPGPVYEDAAGTTPLSGVTAIAVGEFHACALKASGEVWCWGDNSAGQLAPAVPAFQSAFARVSVARDYVALAAGAQHTCGIDNTGRVMCWGFNVEGQLGDGTNDNSAVPRFTGLADARYVGGSRRHTCATLVDGSAYCWGVNSAGELGGGFASVGENAPVQVVDLPFASAIGGGDKYSCASTDDGRVRCWGLGDDGRLGTGNNNSSLTPVLVNVASAISAVTETEGHRHHTCARLSDGTAACWGDNAAGQLGNGETQDDGAELAVVSHPTFPARQIAPGASHSCAVGQGGAVSCWGANASGQLGTGNTLPQSRPVEVSARALSVQLGAASTCALAPDRTVWCWGDNTGGRLGFASGATNLPRQVPGLSEVRSLSLGAAHQCALRLDGRVFCWGVNAAGQVDGVPSATIAAAPREVSGVSGAQAIAAGDQHTCALIAGGRVRCWGLNANLQLGRANATDASVGEVSGVTDAIDLAAGSAQTCIRRVSNGVVNCWGSHAEGALGRTQLTFGTNHATPQALSTPSGARFHELSRGRDMGCATNHDGDVYCWGANGLRELGDGTDSSRAAPAPVICLP